MAQTHEGALKIAAQRIGVSLDEYLLKLKSGDRTETPVFFKGNISETIERGFSSDALNRWREDFPVAYRTGEAIPAVDERQQRCKQFGWPLIGGDQKKDSSLF